MAESHHFSILFPNLNLGESLKQQLGTSREQSLGRDPPLSLSGFASWRPNEMDFLILDPRERGRFHNWQRAFVQVCVRVNQLAPLPGPLLLPGSSSLSTPEEPLPFLLPHAWGPQPSMPPGLQQPNLSTPPLSLENSFKVNLQGHSLGFSGVPSPTGCQNRLYTP